MKKWLTGGLLTALLVTGGVFVYSYIKPVSVTSQSVKQTIEKNQQLTNYQRELSLSVSFDDVKKGTNTPLRFQSNPSVLVVDTTRSGTNEDIQYDFSSHGQEFKGEHLDKNHQLVVKSPMYQRFITFHSSLPPGSDINKNTFSMIRGVAETYLNHLPPSAMQVSKDMGANEKGILTVKVEGQNESTHALIQNLASNVIQDACVQKILKEEALIKNKLVTPHKTESQIAEDSNQRLISFQQRLLNLLHQSKVDSSVLTMKVGENGIIIELTAKVSLTYRNPDNHSALSYTVYLNEDTWNVGNAIVRDVSLNRTNSIAYEEMNGSGYLNDANLQSEVNPGAEKGEVYHGIKESTSTLKELGNFTPVFPKPLQKTPVKK
ncbi:hypothetical protein PP175_27680 (plasmid) [Aneurinibacillus sp. Ricciae_BoGa-3]|uniref:hypothetical protein n=1 Tax=Aneurinibacillus sp. Ricciae_BoGa-3 TaxID=3022697 RepID=UPI00234243F3|nr:hypothetical protein [Aneurinibacillus sp. Ricciae_BoGa-3]WCK56975.1 hypothetical protein PP175_27680 [Aneurinibacillus sp. Ricciae_BoGa-3]